MGSPKISIPKNDNFSFLRAGKPNNKVFSMTTVNLIDTINPIREYYYEDYTSGEENNNSGINTSSITIQNLPPLI